MGSRKKLAIFDFCGTIFKLQSPDMYADFVAKQNLRTKMLQVICNILSKSEKYCGIHHKKVKLYKIKGTTKAELTAKAKYFVENVVLKNLIEDVVKELDKYIEDPDYDVIIASGGYNLYLEYFCELKKIPYMISTNIEVINDVATGKIEGIDCFGPNKILKLNKVLDVNSYDLESSICFSDSMSDKPLFNLVGNKIFVAKSGDNYTLTKL